MENCKNNFPTVRFLRHPILMFNTLRAVAQVWGEGGDGGMWDIADVGPETWQPGILSPRQTRILAFCMDSLRVPPLLLFF